ncbi:DUF4118 domain-containing protein [Roseateles saccharophilus]|uniref:PAS domain-containing protein n=1 Tax=Roseateles saccharophilus TaxID=304 RepID=A0A4V2VNA7_ROSSA|nr:DUF4118 domain-containing protein [Roseateles saccharophilus]MDG0836072.1 DUF4118 domain-containing protein [Roseateles saccharophilus]TCU82733.1 PAS domain-containing protein [Roseateles saccharophilus]
MKSSARPAPAVGELPAWRRRLSLATPLLLPLGACALQWLLWAVLRPYVWFLFYPATFVAALLGGLGGGIVATLLSSLLVWTVFIHGHAGLQPRDLTDLFSVTVFLGTGLAFSLFSRRMQQLVSWRAAAEAMRLGDLRFRALFDNALEGVLIGTPEGEILAANHVAQRMFGRGEATLRRVGQAGVIDTSDPRFAAALEERDRVGSFRAELRAGAPTEASSPWRFPPSCSRTRGAAIW